LVVLNEIHSSPGKSKNIKQDFIDLPRHFTAEGTVLSHLPLKLEL